MIDKIILIIFINKLDRTVVGLILSVLVGLSLGILMGFSKTIRIGLFYFIFPICVSISIGLSTLEREYEDILLSLGANKFEIFYKIALPKT